MKTNLKKQFLEELKKVPIIQVACEKVGISRQTYYRWKKESKAFAKETEEALSEGIAFVNDMSETQLLNLIKGQDFKAISFWLKHRNQIYKEKVELIHKKEDLALTKEQIAIINNAVILLEHEK
jgi:hypothetical protein